MMLYGMGGLIERLRIPVKYVHSPQET